MKSILIAAGLGLAALGAEPVAIEPPRTPEEAMRMMRHFEQGPLTEREVVLISRESPGMTDACIAKARAGGMNAIGGFRTDQCYRMTEPKRWTGLWRDDFEGSQFCPAPATTCGYVEKRKRSEPIVWLEVNRTIARDGRRAGGLYAVDLVGRRTVIQGHHGHLGMFDHALIVDRLISMKEVEPPPPPPSEADQMEMMIREEARGTFFPNAETKKRMQDYIKNKGEPDQRKR